MLGRAVSWLLRLVRCERSLPVQLTELAVFAAVIPYSLHRLRRVVLRWCADKPWMAQVRTNGRQRLRGMGLPESDEVAVNIWVDFWGIGLQHAAGGLLCLPVSTGGWGLPAGVPAALGRHVALAECGYELGDVCLRIHRWLRLPEARQEMPALLWALLLLHHCLAMGMAIPMNLRFGDSPLYFQMVALLQGTAAFIILVAQYGQTLDVSRPPELAGMFWSSVVLAIGMVQTRFVHYAVLAARLVRMAEAAGLAGTAFHRSLIATLAVFGLSNVVYTVDSIKRVLKFGPMYFSQVTGRRISLPGPESGPGKVPPSSE